MTDHYRQIASNMPAPQPAFVRQKLRDLGNGFHAPEVALAGANEAGQVPVVLAGGENHVGQVGGSTGIVTAVPVVSAAPAYSIGDCIGGLMTFAGITRAVDKTAYIQQVSIFCKSLQNTLLDLVLFHTNPTGSTFTDNAALNVVAADFDKIIGVVHITDWTALAAAISYGQSNREAMPFKPASGSDTIYGVLVARAALTLGSTSDIKVALKAPQD